MRVRRTFTDPYNNAKMESFYRTLKLEEAYMFEYQTYAYVAERINYFIEEIYNKKRSHSSLVYIPPEEFYYIFKNNKIKAHQLAPT